MRRAAFTLFFMMLFFLSQGGMSQKWRDYFSYKPCFDVVETDESILGVTGLGLVMYHKQTRSVSVLNKTNGLSDSDISAAGYLPRLGMTLLGYSNGNIDLLTSNSIQNIPDLKIDNLVGSKKINHFMVLEDEVYCSTDFGVLVIDPNRKEIAATYYIGPEASAVQVQSMAADNTHIYAATSRGVLRAPRDSDQLAFFETWELLSPSALFYSDVEIFDGEVLAARGERDKQVTVEVLSSGNTQTIGSFNNFWSLTVHPGTFSVDTRGSLYFYDNTFQRIGTVSDILVEEGSYRPWYKKSLTAEDGTLWIADYSGGLFFEEGEAAWQQVLPSGPYSNQVFNATQAGDDLWVLPGGFKEARNNAGIPAYASVLSNGRWHYFTRSNTPEFRGSTDLINIVEHPENPGRVMVASWGSGIFEFNNLELIRHHTKDNSGLQNVFDDERRYTRIQGMAYDQQQNLWATNSSVKKGVVVRTPDDEWFQYDYETLSTPNSLGDIVVDNNGYKWLIVHRGEAKGLFVFDDNATLEVQNDDRYRGVMPPSRESDDRNAGQLLLWDENGEEIIRDFFSLAIDRNGYLWIGTGNGVVVQYNTRNVFDDEKPVFSRIKVPRNDGSGLADYLLEGERITSIAVDGANRKYLGTQNSGVYLVSEDGAQTVASYNRSNSPLPSNVVNHLSIDPQSGEVFVSTDMGLVSFRGDAVKGKGSFQKVYAYPNPVPGNYQGDITITGLVERTNVKITDTAGNLVYETISLGGNALWNGKNMWGKKVKAGIYIVLVASPDGNQSAYTKIAVIR